MIAHMHTLILTLRKDGTQHWCDVTLHPVLSGSGSFEIICYNHIAIKKVSARLQKDLKCCYSTNMQRYFPERKDTLHLQTLNAAQSHFSDFLQPAFLSSGRCKKLGHVVETPSINLNERLITVITHYPFTQIVTIGTITHQKKRINTNL